MAGNVPPVDLDHLEGRLRSAAMGSLRVGEHYGIHLYAGESPVGMTLRPADAAAIVASVNSLPDLIAELRDLRVESEKRLDALIRVRAERDALRAKVAAVEALAEEIEARARRNLDAARREPISDLAKRHRSRGLGQDTDAKLLRAALAGGS